MPGQRMRRCLTLSTVAVAAVAALSTPAYAADASRYVALGDSFTAGPLVPNQTGDPVGCFRSTRNYPSLIADQLGVDEFTDVSCSGATTEHMAGPQKTPIGTNDPQLDAVTSDTSLVTLGISGNDIGFGGIMLTCAGKSVTNPFGSPCKNGYTDSGTDELRDRIAETRPKVDAVLTEISKRAPDATLIVVGYPALLPEKDGCLPKVPISKGDVSYLDDVEQDLNAMLADAAAGVGAEFAVNYERGHDMCSARSDRWVEGIIPTKPAFPVHPNAEGFAAIAANVIEKVGQPVQSPGV